MSLSDGGLVQKDPSDIAVYGFNWAAELGDALIVTSTFTVDGLRGDLTTTPLTLDAADIGADEQSTTFRLSAGALGSKWRVNNKIVTNETPAQTLERSGFIKLEQR